MGYYDDSKNVDDYIQMCDEYDGKNIYELLAKYLAKGSTLLELGSGPGLDIKNLKDHYRVSGSDLSDEFLKRLKLKFPDVPFYNIDITNVNIKEKFDCIYSNKVLHHIDEAQLQNSLKQQKDSLSKSGLIAHSFWIGEESMQIHGLLFTYYTKEAILKLIQKNFEVLETLSYTEFEENDSLVVIAKAMNE